jgi:spermidine synthase
VSRPAAVLRWRAAAALAVAAVAAVALVEERDGAGSVRSRARNFFGSLTVYDEGIRGNRNELRVLHHGLVSHGEQYVHSSRRREATAYYGPESGIGRAMLAWKADGPRRIGVVGLGAGTLAAYARRGDVLRFYELNPLVVAYARRDFTYLADTDAGVTVALGDGRLVLESEAPQRFDVLVADAFSGDAVPVHLLTREAFELYRRHLAPDGLLAVNVTNRYLDLAPVSARAAQSVGGTARAVSSRGFAGGSGRYRSHWVLIAWPAGVARAEWASLGNPLSAEGQPWTDDYSDLLSALR